MTDLLTRADVAKILHRSERSVMRINLPVVRIGKKPLYDPRDVTRFVEASKCQSSNDRARRTSTANSLSRGEGLAEALAAHRPVKREHTNERSGRRNAQRSDAAPLRQASHSKPPVLVTGRSTDAT